ncbi:helix-turn-helix transcriptional regulator [Mycobacterium sp. SMC-4]|uniref:helix-turn-helix transcriptional regulator n=1 Tax=Mycobacterium sp. SMC-4 TaxID=2857059 RepID=UPI0021B36D9C|nr:helix-turn-helix transcriptional regulator [Mycobacterium sp. SMC-4]UXA18410.1 helix-turn-helix transcriptional regulator [Mycobacterium sp. SMC-4]
MPETVLVDADDVGEAVHALSAVYSAMRVVEVPGSTASRTRVFRSRIGELTIDDAEFTYRLVTDMDPTDSVLVCRVRSGLLGGSGPGHDLQLHGAGSVLAFGGAAGQPIVGHIDRARYDVVVIARSLLAEVAPQGWGADPDAFSLLAMSPVSPEANRHLADTLSHLRMNVGSSAYARGEPLVTGPLTRYVASSVLAAFPNSASRAATAHSSADTSRRLLERALAFVDDRADTDVSVADIATAVRVAPSAVVAMFAAHLSCTPMAYLRRVRLHHAHRELMGADPAKTSVAEVAARWGFGVVESFGVHYRSQYGVDPLHTLAS